MRSDAYIKVICDTSNCRTEIEIQLTATTRGYDERYVDNELKFQNWLVEDGNDFCPNCKETKEKKKNKRI